MDACQLVTETLSALVDGEEGPLSAEACDEHLAGCADCRRFERGLLPLVRASRVHAADAVPDLTAAILAAAPPVVVGHGRRLQARWTLALVGVTQSLLALAAMLASSGHLNRDLAIWQLALGVGFAVAAWQPSRAAGLLPMLAVLGAAAVVAATGDLMTGSATLVGELPHLVEVAGLGLLWWLSRLVEAPRRAPAVASR